VHLTGITEAISLCSTTKSAHGESGRLLLPRRWEVGLIKHHIELGQVEPEKKWSS